MPHEIFDPTGTGEVGSARYLIHDRDTEYTGGFEGILESAGIKVVKLTGRTV